MTKKIAATAAHFQLNDSRLVERNRTLLVSIDFLEPHVPLKNLRYIHSAIPIGKIDQGGAIVESSRVQTAMPRELTIKPVSTDRINNGILLQAAVV
jgi:hypothetical protein